MLDMGNKANKVDEASACRIGVISSSGRIGEAGVYNEPKNGPIC